MLAWGHFLNRSFVLSVSVMDYLQLVTTHPTLKVIIVDARNRVRLFNAGSHAMLNHQTDKLAPSTNTTVLPSTFSTYVIASLRIPRGKENAFPGFLSNKRANKISYIARRHVVSRVSLSLNVNHIEAEYIFLYQTIDAAIARPTNSLGRVGNEPP